MKDKLLFHPLGRWFEQSSLESPVVKNSKDLEGSFVDNTKQMAEKLLENESTVYRKEKERTKPSDVEWLKNVTNSGTLGDKVAALAIQIQDSPLHHLKTLDVLLNMANKKGRRECLIAIDTLKDLWLVNLLPNDRKLKRFSEFPLKSAPQKTNQGGRDAWNKKLMVWYFEDQLKKRYENFVLGLKRLLHDNLENVRNKVLGVVYELLVEKPEQEKALLLYLVNKVGDPNRKIASKAGHLLGCLVQKHPNMKMIITLEVERLLYRPNIGLKAQYYAVCFLNQLILSKKDSSLASNLITIYFSLFKAFVDKGQVETKMLSALLSGVSRAFYYVKDDEDQFSEQVNMLFRVVHITSFNTCVQALMLLFQVMDSRQSMSDRFYQALYAKLLDPHLRMSSKQAMFLNVIYKSLKIDTSLKRVKAFVKRLLQVCSTQTPAFVCGVLYLLSEVGKVKPGIKSLVTQPEELDEEEHFTDVIDPEDPESAPSLPSSDVSKQPNAVHETSSQGHVFVDSPHTSGYQANARNPLYSGADNSCLWEVMKLSRHYHPSVSRFAQNLLQGESISYDGDPLSDFTLMRFLDRFVYKNPKKKVQDHGGSLMQPQTISQRQFEQPVNTTAFLNKKEESVREDEIFFYRYFKQKAVEDERENKNVEKDDASEEDDETLGGFGDEITMDFAGEFQKSKTSKQGKNKEYGDSDEEDMLDDEEFDYNDMQFSEDEMEDSNDEKKKYSEKDYEKALLENLSSDEFSDDGDDNSSPKKKKKFQSSEDTSMFADAEEFAHLLEDSGGFTQGGSEDVDMRGVSWKQQQWETNRMHQNSSRRNKFRGGKNRGKGSRNLGQGSLGLGKSSRNFGEGRKEFGNGRRKPRDIGSKRKTPRRKGK
ncbi:CCAAT/enhancer-binding protein zeta-like isoform X2 [Dendronephthya gigantea]|uniref:CCAAT/enhancer-binding protein zeta-like isoform X2 n=1 Tax=Dendronephthya gigantea TaxID=151771 RepID=UPI00106D3B99|nr:CCAAT/enhancer-binding protein zeta-like isoform X2 [Dendronephthya gigantea]